MYTDLKPNSKSESPEQNIKDIPTYNVVPSNTIHSSKNEVLNVDTCKFYTASVCWILYIDLPEDLWIERTVVGNHKNKSQITLNNFRLFRIGNWNTKENGLEIVVLCQRWQYYIVAKRLPIFVIVHKLLLRGFFTHENDAPTSHFLSHYILNKRIKLSPIVKKNS